MIDFLYSIASICFAVSLILTFMVNQNFVYAIFVFWVLSVFFDELKKNEKDF